MADSGDDRLNTDEDAPKGGRARGGNGRFASGDRENGERTASERERDEREQTQDRELSEDERLELFRDSLVQSVMPDLPHQDGYHVCWLTTSNPRDTIAWRKRLGYELIRAEDMPAGLSSLASKQGEYQGIVSINEMVAARLPMRLYNKYMKEVHDRMPLDEEGKLRSQIDSMKADAEQQGLRMTAGPGTEAIVQRAPPMPEFTH